MKRALSKTKEVNKKLFKIYDETTFRVDTGADISVIKSSEKHDELLNTATVEDYEGNTKSKNVWRKNEIKVILGNENLLCPSDLVKIGRIGIVDKDKEINRLVEESELSNKKELERILRRHSDCYAQSKNDCGRVDKKYEHVIKGGIPPPQRQYRINSAAEAEIGETIKELTDQGVIRRLGKNEQALTNAPIQAVPKPDGTWRLVTNFKALNKVTVPDTRYLINCSETSGDIGRDKEWLSKLDLANGCWSIPLALDSQKKTAFTYKGEQFIHKVLPQGFKNSGNHFQAVILDILSGIPVTVYIDDILISSSTEEEHLKVLDLTLQIS